MTLPAPLGRAHIADHCDRWHTSLGRLIKVLAVLCQWINARMGTLDGFPISDQLDYVNAVGGQLLKSAWTRFSRIPAGLWTIPLGRQTVEKSCCYSFLHVTKSADLLIQLKVTALPPLLLLLSPLLSANLTCLSPQHLPHKANHSVVIICSPQAQQGSQVVREADFLQESCGFDASFHQHQCFFKRGADTDTELLPAQFR